MKKIIKAAFAALGALTLMELTNRAIFKLAESKEKEGGLCYPWRYGNVRYTKAGAGKPLLLIHGVYPGASLHEWDKAIAALSRHYTVYAVDLPGFGQSVKPEITYSAYLYARFINDFIKNVIKKDTNERAFVAASAQSSVFALAAAKLDLNLIEKLMLVSPQKQNEETAKLDVLILKLLSSGTIGVFIYNMLSSRLALTCFLRRNGTVKNIGEAGQMWQSAHNGGAGARLPIFAKMAKLLSCNTTMLAQGLNTPIHVFCGGSKAFPHRDEVKAFYRECKDFFM